MIIEFRRRPNAGAQIGPSGERVWKRDYFMRSNSPDELRSYILNFTALPQYGSIHPEDPWCTVTDIDLNQSADNSFVWMATVKWSASHSGRNEKDDQKQPDQRRPQWSKRFTPIPNYLPQDLQGKLFCDSAGTPFDPPPEMPIWVQEVTIVRYEDSWDDERDLAYIYATNTDSWRNSNAGEALVGDIGCVEEYLNGTYWYKYTWKILQNPKISLPGGAGTIGGWDPLLIVDAGPKCKQPGPGGTTIIAPAVQNGYVDGRAVYLDGAGNRNTGSTPFMLQFQVKNKKSFGELDLDAPWDA